MTITENTRIYTTDILDLGDDRILPGAEGTVIKFTGDDAYDLLVELDAGILVTVNSGDVATC